MEKINVLLGILNKQKSIIEKLYSEVHALDLKIYENNYVFALKTQQLYTATEDMLKAVAITFENSIEDYSKYHYHLLKTLSMEVPEIRPPFLGENSLVLLDKLRGFRHFIRHGYNYELDAEELVLIQNKLNRFFPTLISDTEVFGRFLTQLIKEDDE